MLNFFLAVIGVSAILEWQQIDSTVLAIVFFLVNSVLGGDAQLELAFVYARALKRLYSSWVSRTLSVKNLPDIGTLCYCLCETADPKLHVILYAQSMVTDISVYFPVLQTFFKTDLTQSVIFMVCLINDSKHKADIWSHGIDWYLPLLLFFHENHQWGLFTRQESEIKNLAEADLQSHIDELEASLKATFDKNEFSDLPELEEMSNQLLLTTFHREQVAQKPKLLLQTAADELVPQEEDLQVEIKLESSSETILTVEI